MTIGSELRGPRPLRLGVAYDPAALCGWQALCLSKLAAAEGVELTLLAAPTPRQGGRLWRAFSRRMARRSQALAPAALPVQVSSAPAAGLADAAPHLDAILCLAPCAAEALRAVAPLGALAPRYGVWAFRFGPDGAWDRAHPAAWEIIHDELLLGASLQRLPDAHGGGRVLRSGCARILRASFSASADAALAMCAAWPAQACNDIRYGHSDRWPVAPAVADLRGAPGDLQTIRLNLMLGLNALRELAARTMLPRWNIGVVEQPIARFLEPGFVPVIRWLPLARGVFRADPFGVAQPGRMTILCEHLDYCDSVGELRALEVADGRILSERVILPSPGHCSYPYLFCHNGRTYCIPEMLDTDELALYRAESFPHAWAKAATLVTGFKGGDATVFQHEGRWWLLANDSGQRMDHSLYAWYADNLFGPWTPHLNNPIKTDVRSSRPAGAPFVHQGRLIRPAQDCALRYGHRVALNHITRLTPTDFAEETLAVVGPYAGPFSAGMHTLSAAGDATLVDGLSYFFFAADPRQLLHGLRRIPHIVRSLWSKDEHAFSSH